MDQSLRNAVPARAILLIVLSLATGSLFARTTAFSKLPAVAAVLQAGPTTWRPYGPHTQNLTIPVYSDFQSMYHDFANGQLDITDFPVQSGSGLGANPDIFLTTPQSELGVDELDVNHHAAFMGVAQLGARVTVPLSFGAPTFAAGCSTGFGSLSVTLFNQETGLVALDGLNNMTVSGPTTFTTMDSGAKASGIPNGVYAFPCLIAGAFTVSTTVYQNCSASNLAPCTVSTSSGTVESVKFNTNWNSPSTQKLTLAGTEVRRALAHLLDKPSFAASLGGTCDDTFANATGCPGQVPVSVVNEDCAEHPWFTPCAPPSAYNLASDSIAGGSLWWNGNGLTAGATAGYSGVSDLRAACDHFVLAGLAITPAGKTCLDVANASTGMVPPASYAHLVAPSPVVFYISSNPERKAFGQVIADSLNFLFGTPTGGTVLYGSTTTPTYYSTTQVLDIVYSSAVLDDWNLYTGLSSFGAAPNHVYNLLHSGFGAAVCGGTSTVFPNNYVYSCDPAYDADAFAGQYSSGFLTSLGLFARALITGLRGAMNVPVLSRQVQFAALNGWNFQPSTEASIVSSVGHGFGAGSGYWSLLNMHQNTSVVPVNASFTPGGGNPDLMRRGFSQGIHEFSPFQAVTPWEQEMLGLVFDTMLKPNPLTWGSNLQVIDWMTTSHSSSFSPTEVSCVGPSCVTGTTTQVWHLRSDLLFHDGVPVTADDVAYSILAYRDVPSSLFRPNVVAVSGAVALDSRTVQVKLQLRSVFYDLSLGSVPIIPKHAWSPICGVPPSPFSPCASPSFDPVAGGVFFGSGPFVCANFLTGAVGGPCTQSLALGAASSAANQVRAQDVLPGGKILLTSFSKYMRGPVGLQGTGLQALSWADMNNDGTVNILENSAIAACFNAVSGSCLYWDHPQYGVNGIVDFGDLKVESFYFGHGLIGPFTPAQVIGLDPRIDPFQIGNFYYLGTTRTATGVAVNLDNLGGAVITGSVSSRVGGVTNTTMFSIPANSRIAVSFQVSASMVRINVALSTGEKMTMRVPIWLANPPASFYQDLYLREWSDGNNDGWITQLDISDIASCFGALPGVGTSICTGAAASYWNLTPCAPGGPVDICDVARVAFYYDTPLHSWLLQGPDLTPFPGDARGSHQFDYRWNCSLLPPAQQSYCAAHP